MKHLKDTKLLSDYQYGFIEGRSTVTQLLNFLSNCISHVVDRKTVDTIYFDFSKAFDTVSHKRLLKKIEAYGISGNILSWIKNYLVDRTQLVKVNGASSYPTRVLSGIPQGSVLGPILFLIYINDLPEVVKSFIHLFADDTKLHALIKNTQDALALQEDITNMELWSAIWLVNFHPDKCHVLTVGRHQDILHVHKYILNGVELEHVFEEKDLGVIIDSELKFEEHIAEKVKKANIVAGLIQRSFSHLNSRVFKTLFGSFVRPLLEYASVVWSPHLKKHINLIERVQRRATKRVEGLENLPYIERLKRLELTTLTFRRLRTDMIEVYKHIHKHDEKATMSNNFNLQTRAKSKTRFTACPERATRWCQKSTNELVLLSID